MPAKMKDKPPGWDAFRDHRNNARRRGIAFEFTYAEWWAWWQVDDRWFQRGRGKLKLCMARVGDVGPYAPNNVYCATHRRNGQDADQGPRVVKRLRAPAPAGTLHRRGGTHPRSRPIMTPEGQFSTATFAAKAFKITRQHAARLARKGADGWYYLDG